MKNITAVILNTLLLIGLLACSKKSDPTAESNNPTSSIVKGDCKNAVTEIREIKEESRDSVIHKLFELSASIQLSDSESLTECLDRNLAIKCIANECHIEELH